MCHKYNINFDLVTEQFDIIQNNDDQFRGEKISILYDPGIFPALMKYPNGNTTKLNQT